MAGAVHDDWMQLERFSFGDGPALIDSLLALVLSGAKTATCWAARDGKLTEVGKRMVACDSTGTPRVVLETVTLEQARFDEVDEDFAREEGEGDLTLAWWREAHQAYFERNGGFDPKMLLWCERFRVVRLL
ncbi:ASCH domain-containing protein [Cystobacter fuscus]|uniref:ASCH domain-containing protein n=1 Tax=Cystobacter fuscus TaxID=43 RepID=UPI002B292D00|nr:ASCH domain-containing protein [Cystobacter fuscus]